MKLSDVEYGVREYLKTPPRCVTAPLSRECEYFAALMQVAGDFRVDFRAEPWASGLRLMPRLGLWRETAKGKR